MGITYEDIIRRAEHYGVQDGDYTTRYPFFASLAESLVKAFSPQTVLDMGCNSGALVKAFIDLNLEAYGIDIAEDALSAAPDEIRENLLGVNAIEEALPFEDEKFDLVTVLDVFEHLPQYGSFITEMKRVLKKGHFAYVSIPSHLEDLILYREGLFRRQNHEQALAHCNLHNKKYWIKLLGDNGFKYLGDFPKENYMKAVNAVMPQSGLKRMIFGVINSRLIPDYRINLILQKM